MGAMAAIVRAALPRIDYFCGYNAKVVRCVDGLVDVVPDDPDVPTMPGLRIYSGLPGVTIAKVEPGTFVTVYWSEGDPSRPYAALWSGGEHVVAMTIAADTLTLGGADGAQPPIKASPYLPAESTFLDAIVTALSAALSALGLSSAAATLTAAQTAFKAQSSQFASTNVKVK